MMSRREDRDPGDGASEPGIVAALAATAVIAG